jgi:hypothetical protein
MVKGHGFSRAGFNASEVWIYDDDAGERAIRLVRSFLAAQSDYQPYPGSRGIALALNLVGVASVAAGVLQLAVGIFDGDRIATALTFVTIGAFLYAQGNVERRKTKETTQ